MLLAERIERLYNQQTSSYDQEFSDTFQEFKQGLNSGVIRAAEAVEGEGSSGWKVNPWVKKGILLGFRIGILANMSIDDKFPFYDKNTYPLK